MLACVVGDGLLLPCEEAHCLIEGSVHRVPRVSNGEAKCPIGQQVSTPVNLLNGKDEALGHPVAPHGDTGGERSPHYHSLHGKWNKNEHCDSGDLSKDVHLRKHVCRDVPRRTFQRSQRAARGNAETVTRGGVPEDRRDF